MKPFVNTQEIANTFNEDEAVWRRYRQKPDLRLLHGSLRLFPHEVLGRLNWFEAERECRERRYVGGQFHEAV